MAKTDRRSFLRSSLGTSLLAGATSLCLPATARAQAKPATKLPPDPTAPTVMPALGTVGPKKKKVLFVYGGWPGHEPPKNRDHFVPWMRDRLGWEVIVSDKQDPYGDKALMMSIDLIVQIWTMGTIKGDHLKGLLAAVQNGCGIAGWHGGLADAYRQETEYQFMVGGQWVSHPGNIIDYTVNIIDHEDPITRDLADFKVRTEQYYMHVDPNNKVLATTTFNADHAPWIDGATMPVVWKRVYGKGRVFYTSLGHTADVWDTLEADTIIKRGMLWASDSKYQKTPNLVQPRYPRI